MRAEILPLDPRFSARKAKRGFESEYVVCDAEQGLFNRCSLKGTYFCLNICSHGRLPAA